MNNGASEDARSATKSGSSAPVDSNTEDILKNLRKLNSCITLKSAPTAGSRSNDNQDSSSEDYSSEDERESNGARAPALPNRSSSISIKSSTESTNLTAKQLYSGLLKRNENNTVTSDKSSSSSDLSEWSKRSGLSISFSRGNGVDKRQGGGSSSLDRDRQERNGSPHSSENSRDSYSEESESETASRLDSSSKPDIGNNSTFNCSLCSAPFPNKISLVQHIPNCSRLKGVSFSNNQKRGSDSGGSSRSSSRSPSPPPLSKLKLPSSISINSGQQISKESSVSSVSTTSSETKQDSSSFQSLLHLYPHLAGSVSSVQSKEPKETPNSNYRSYSNPRPISKCVARKSTEKLPRPQIARRSRDKPSCEVCGIERFDSWLNFEDHHLDHIDTDVKVRINRLSTRRIALETNTYFESSDSEASFSERNSACNSPSFGESRTDSAVSVNKGEDKGLRLTFKISRLKKKGRGRKRRTVRIISSEFVEGLDEDDHENDNDKGQVENERTLNSPSHEEKDPDDPAEVESDARLQLEEDSPNPHDSTIPPAEDQQSSAEEAQFTEDFGADLNFDDPNTTSTGETPSSSYQPQFESFPGNDWFNEYDSGPRIAAAMTGSSEGEQQGGNHYSSEDPRTHMQNGVSGGSEGSNSNQSESDGLFSQAVLGNDNLNHSQNSAQSQGGSFEQLCLNDSFGQQQQQVLDNQQQNQGYQANQQTPGNDLLSELDYLNSSQQMQNNSQMQMQQQPQHQEMDPQQYNSHGSNSGTPNQISPSHPVQSPTDTSFRTLATSPAMASPLQSPTGSTSPHPSVSPLQQMGQMGGTPLSQQPMSSPDCAMQQTQSPTPRITVANNLMAASTANNIGGSPVVGGYNQWAGTNQGYNTNYMSNQSMAGQTLPGQVMTGSPLAGQAMGGAAMPGQTMPLQHAALPISYRPSPPPRIRGRPPLMGQMNRPPLMRGPGRPPGANAVPHMIPGGGRGGMMQPMRHNSYTRGGGVGHMAQKRPAPNQANSQSPSKTPRREDINVPSRQKDSECQIIAVANRASGLPVISNVQGGGSNNNSNRSSPSTSPATTDSTIHLSDSITLSVRSNQAGGNSPREAPREKGDAGVVANLLASRGITVTPAAGEKEGGAGDKNDRRLPSASDLNLSSAISVHPPTSRDRDGFAVPLPPAKNSSSGSVERPPRPPTVDLTQDTPTQGPRHLCSECDRTFPSAGLLADHSKVHQSQQQSRMPYKCHLCTAGFSSQKGQQHHYNQFHQLQLSAGDLAIPVVDFRNPTNVQRMGRLGIRSFLPLSNLQNRGSGGIVGIPILSLENVHNGQMTMQQWGITDVISLGPPKTLNVPR